SRRALGGGGVEDHVNQRKSEEEFGEHGGSDRRRHRLHGDSGFEELHHHGGHDRAQDLKTHVGNDILGVASTANPHAQGHGRIVMSAGDVTAGENHDHQCRANRQRRNDSVSAINHRAADRQHEKESSNEFGQVFFHNQRVDIDSPSH